MKPNSTDTRAKAARGSTSFEGRRISLSLPAPDDAADRGQIGSIPRPGNPTLSAVAPGEASFAVFHETWMREREFSNRLGCFRKHLDAALVVVAVLGRHSRIERLVGRYCEDGDATAREEALSFLVSAAKEAPNHPSGGCCRRYEATEHGYAEVYQCLHPRSSQHERLALIVAFREEGASREEGPSERRHENVLRLFPLVLEAAELEVQLAANVSIDQMLQQSQRLASVGRLASGIAHDFNNLLTVIQGNVAMLGELLGEHNDPCVHESIRQVASASQRAADLARQLLRFSRGEEEKIERIDLNEVVSDFMGMASRLLEDSIEVRVELAEDQLGTFADRGMVGQMLMNLVVNARDAMPEGGEISIKTARVPDGQPGDESWVCLEVADNGCGIPPEQLGKIFDPFFTTKERGKGTGLGLPNTKALVEKLGGTMLVESVEGEGTRFELRFRSVVETVGAAGNEPAESTLGGDSSASTASPVESARGHHRPPQISSSGSSESNGGGIRGATVLLVEDDGAVRKLVRRLLEMNGCHVIEAQSGREAIERWPEIRDSVSLVVSDVIMPGGVSGWDLARSLHEDRPELGILLTSGYTEHAGKESLASIQQLEFLQKPYEASKLRDTLCRLHRSAA